jgi:DNA-directed RNA polymerase specialized sigma24 family protein
MSPQAGWLLQEEVIPRLRSAIPHQVNHVGSEDAEELIADGICMAARLLHNAEKANKTVTAGNIAYYTILHMKSGRRSTGHSNADVLGSATQLNGRSLPISFDEPVHEELELGEEFTVNDVLSFDEEDPAQKAARNMDWECFLTGLTAREKGVVEYLLAGRNLSELARTSGIDRSTIQSFKNRVADKILDYMGRDILVEIRRMPGWRNNLNANRERLACKVDRRH